MQKHIIIPKPCHENWREMTPKEQGHHCDKCDKIVTDFSAMSNEEILSFLQKQKGEVCGRVRADQLNNATPLTDKLKKFSYAFCLVFFPLLGNAQENKTQIDSMQSIKPKRITLRKPSCKTMRVTASSGPSGVSGIIRNEKGYRIPNAKFIVKQSGKIIAEVTADSNGEYELKTIEKGMYEFEVSADKFKTLILIKAEIKKGHIWDLDLALSKKRKRSKAAYETRYAPKNFGNEMLMGSVGVLGMISVQGFTPWRVPGHPMDLVDAMFIKY